MTESWVVHIVDDDEPVRASLAFALQLYGFQAVTYGDAGDFLMRGRKERGVLVSDVRMPGLDGIELTRLLRCDGSTMPIILITGHADDQLKTEAMNAGANLVLGKPVDLNVLAAEITRVTTGWE